jgi:hypothetical protein
MTKEQIIEDFESNFLNGDRVSNNGLRKFYLDGVLEIANHFYEKGKDECRLSEEQEEREAWDRYVSAYASSPCRGTETSNGCAGLADNVLAERRKRFGK